jgi:hypothetical protein
VALRFPPQSKKIWGGTAALHLCIKNPGKEDDWKNEGYHGKLSILAGFLAFFG